MKNRIAIAGLVLVATCASVVVEAASPGQSDAERGAACFRNGDFSGARAAFENAVRLDPGLFRAWRDLGWAHQRLGRESEAMRIWRNLLKVDPRNADVHRALGEVHLGRGRFEEALSHLRRSLELQPGRTETRLRLGEAWDGLGRPTEAVAEYRRVAASGPHRAAALAHWADLLERQGELRQAVVVLDDALTRSPELAGDLRSRIARLEGRIGDEASARGDHAVAREAYRSALDREPAGTRLLTNLGWAERQGGDLEAAIATWNRAVALEDSSPAPLFRAIADAERELGRAGDARLSYDRALRAAPEDPAARFQLARLAAGEGETEEAERWLAELIVLPTIDAAWTARIAEFFTTDDETAARGVAFFTRHLVAPERFGERDSGISRLLASRAGHAQREGRLDDAIDLYTEALRRDSANASAMRDLGWTFWRAGRWGDCEEIWQRYAQIFPELAQPHDLLSQLRLTRGDFAAAIADAVRSLERDPANRATQVRLARAHLNAGHGQEALRLAERLVRDDPESANARTLWAEALTRTRRFTLAAEQWEAVLTIDPDSVRARQQRVLCLYESGAVDAALDLAREAVERTPAPVTLLELLADDAAAREAWDEAARWYRRLTREAPERGAPWIRLSRMLRKLGSHRERIAAIETALAVHPRRVDLQLELASALSDSGDGGAALRRFRELARAHPDNRSAYLGLLDALSDARHDDEALRLLEGNRPGFLKDDEVLMRRARILAAKSEIGAAVGLLDTMTERTGIGAIPILVYHGLSSGRRHLNLAVEDFDDQMAALAAGGYTTITFAELAAMADGLMAVPERPVIVTFDDARADSFEFADPILARHGMRATMFVPTARIGDEDLFHVGWPSLASHVQEGRWELQGHGHEAHDPVIVDERGTTAPFVASPMWVEEEGRPENPDEFEHRLENDYRVSRLILEQRFPGTRVIAHAFPFSEFGQSAGTDESDAVALNERIAGTEYRFGLVQDENGYNTLTGDRTPPFLLRRFSVPRGWDGHALLAHLARHDPRTAARMEQARILTWQGLLDAAEERFVALAREAPLLRSEIDRSLAEIAYRRGRPREARRLLDGRETATLRNDAGLARLSERIDWETRSRWDARMEASSDSDRRSTARQALTLRYPFAAPVDLEMELGRIRLAETGLGVLSGRSLLVRGFWAASTRLALTGWLRHDQISNLEAETVGGVEAGYAIDRHAVTFRGSNETIETARARTAGVRYREVAADYSIRGSLWLPRFQLVERQFSDGNRRYDARASVLYRFSSWQRWQIGATLDRGDSEFQSVQYYTPAGLDALRVRSRYRLAWRSDSSIDAEAGIGLARDDVRGRRWTSNARLNASKTWRPGLQTKLGLEYSSAPGYRSSRAQVTIQFLPWR